METWYSISLGDGMTAGIPLDELREAFERRFRGPDSRSDAAVFSRAESEGRLHCEVVAYFSPAAWEIAQAFEAYPCGKPARSGLELLSGDERCWSVLFPHYDI